MADLIDKVKEILAAENDCSVADLATTMLAKAIETKVSHLKSNVSQIAVKTASEKIITAEETLSIATEQAVVAKAAAEEKKDEPEIYESI